MHALYPASKWALRGFYDSLRMELNESNDDIAVSVMLPGPSLPRSSRRTEQGRCHAEATTADVRPRSCRPRDRPGRGEADA
jgi:short-subunit dehydrogenase